jgi:cell division protein FtsN
LYKKKIFLIGLAIAFALVFILFISKNHKTNMLKSNETTKYFLKELKIRKGDFFEDEDYKKELREKLDKKPKNKKSEIKVEEKIKEEEKVERLYYLQIGTFKNKANAENLMESLSDIAGLRIEKSKYNENYYVLLTDNYTKKELTDISEKIKEKYKTIKPIVKVRY